MLCGRCSAEMTPAPLGLALALVDAWGDDSATLAAELRVFGGEAAWCTPCGRLAIERADAA